VLEKREIALMSMKSQHKMSRVNAAFKKDLSLQNINPRLVTLMPSMSLHEDRF